MKPTITVWPKNRYLNLVATLATGVVIGWMASSAYVFFTGGGERTFLVSGSPHDASEVRLVDVPAGLVDFQFEVRLQRDGEADEVTLFRSPDTDPDSTLYRVAWAKDGSRFVVFRSFGVRGDDLLVLYDLREPKLWSNVSRDDSHPRFTIADVRVVEWAQFPGIQPADGSGRGR